ELDVVTTDRVVDLANESIDVAVRVGRPSTGPLRATHLIDSEFLLVAAPELLEHYEAVAHPRECESMPQVGFRLPSGAVRSWRFARGDETYELEPSGTLTLDDGIAVVAMVCAGLGLSYVPDYLVDREVADGRLVRVLPEWSAPAGSLYCVYHERKESIPRIRAFVEFAQTAVARTVANEQKPETDSSGQAGN
ncbi:MAG: substrate binding domain-containing protein, partial [Myxococcota bacterium]